MNKADRNTDTAKTLFDRIWESHSIIVRDDGDTLLYVDRLLTQENSFHAFDKLRADGHAVRNPGQVFCFSDHYVPTRQGTVPPPEITNMVEIIKGDAAQYGARLFGPDDPDRGILHVVGPEQGITQPGLIIAGADSHTSTHGALGAFGFGVGSSETAHIMATQAIWRKRPKTMRVTIDGRPGYGVTAKDVILAIIGRVGAGGAVGHVIEYAGSTIAGMNVEQRMTICNMSIEAGARAGLVSPDDKTIDYIHGRPYAPEGAEWDMAETWWRSLASDADAVFDREVAIDAASIAPMATWGNSPEDVAPIDGNIPDPSLEQDEFRRRKMERALDYMGLTAGMRLTDIPIDQVFIGSCTNGRIEDLRAAASVLSGRKARIPGIVVPGSRRVKRAAEAEGLDRIFIEAGLEWHDAGCSMCVAINGDNVGAGKRCASTSNRNFEGRQGRGSRTHLVSPMMAAAAAIEGRLADVRTYEGKA
ncbi:MAG: 3-isopropylmalate dehydratase large subunit [Rhodospirillales bacterium]